MPKKAKTPPPNSAASSVDLCKPDARVRLPYRNAPYFVRFSENRYLGYLVSRKGRGTWIARIVLPPETPGGKELKLQEQLGKADDPCERLTLKPILTHAEALMAAVKWCAKVANDGGGQHLAGGYTVGNALDAYFESLNIPNPQSEKTARQRIELTKSEIGHIVVAKLTSRDLEQWRKKKLSMPPRIRPKKGGEPAYRKDWDPTDPEQVRKRKVTLNRALADVKAALTYTLDRNGASSDLPWKQVKPFKKVSASGGDALTAGQVVEFLNQCKPEFRPLAYGALLLAARYGEMTRMKVKAFDPIHSVMHVPEMNTKDGAERQIPLTDEARAVFLEICRGRGPEEFLFVRANGKPWTTNTQQKPMLDSKIAMNIDTHFYWLRHTRITHWLEDGIPGPVIAESVGTSEGMIRRHYRHIGPQAIQKQVNSHSRSEGLSAERIAQANREVAALEQKAEEAVGELTFSLESLHPSTYAGKIKGGSEDPPPPKPKPTREVLENLFAEGLTATAIGHRFEVSDVTVGKWCLALGVDKPGRGHFAKLRAEMNRGNLRTKQRKG